MHAIFFHSLNQLCFDFAGTYMYSSNSYKYITTCIQSVLFSFAQCHTCRCELILVYTAINDLWVLPAHKNEWKVYVGFVFVQKHCVRFSVTDSKTEQWTLHSFLCFPLIFFFFFQIATATFVSSSEHLNAYSMYSM